MRVHRQHQQPGCRHPTRARAVLEDFPPWSWASPCLRPGFGHGWGRRLFVFSQSATRAPPLPCNLEPEQKVLSRHLAWPRAPACALPAPRAGEDGRQVERYLSRCSRASRPLRPRRCESVCHCMTPRESIASSWSQATRRAHDGPVLRALTVGSSTVESSAWGVAPTAIRGGRWPS